jgi:hypothetical protein
MKGIAFLLAAALFILGILTAIGTISLTHSHDVHHWKQTILLWILALLCLIFARLQRPRRAV